MLFQSAKPPGDILSYGVKKYKSNKGCLAQGYPFVFGFSVYESFESQEVAKTGKVNMPKKNEKVAAIYYAQ
jgi:hypothetical protein